jgi:hypothetical protein
VLLSFAVLTSIADLLRHDMTNMDPTLPAILGGCALVAIWVKSVQAKRSVEIDAALNTVSIHSVSALFRPGIRRYPLDKFGSVRSYVTSGRYAKVVVELVTKPGGEALFVAAFPPDNGAKSFWSMSTEAENTEAASLRQAISAYAGVKDHGFLNTRLVGALLNDR